MSTTSKPQSRSKLPTKMNISKSRLPTPKSTQILRNIINDPNIVKPTTLKNVAKVQPTITRPTFKATRRSIAKHKPPTTSVTSRVAITGPKTTKTFAPTKTDGQAKPIGQTIINKRPFGQTARTVSSNQLTKTVSSGQNVGLKRTASAASVTSGTTAKLSKFDYKGRFMQLDEKHKALVEKHKEIKQEHEILQSKFETLFSENQVLQEKHMKLEKHYNELANIKIQYEEVSKAHIEDLSKIEILQNLLLEQDMLKKQLHNQIQDLKGNIRVFCRVRPLMDDEYDKLPCNFNFINESTFEVKKEKGSMSCMNGKMTDLKSEFNFDRVFPGPTTQTEIFEELAQLVESTLDGYNVCVFAYGQTGSGKTFTMMGNEENPGMIPLSVKLLFKRIEELKNFNWKYEVSVSVLEIYNETIRDLLNPTFKGPFNILFNSGKNVSVTNLKSEPVANATKLKTVLTLANNNRAVASTNLNLHSSRSHMVIKLTVGAINSVSNVCLNGSISLVDLAGSENAKNSERMTETKNINKSLASLGTVMLSLFNKERHVPYRNSKLTYLLQSSLGGDSKTIMFVNISPLEENLNETFNSLRFASKVKEVKTQGKRNKRLL